LVVRVLGVFFLSSDLLFNLKRGMKILIVLTMLTLATVRVVVKIEAYDAIFAFLLAASMLLLIDLFRDIKFSDRAIKTVNFSVSYSFTLYLVHYSVLAFIHMLYAQSYSPYILFLCSVVIANLLAWRLDMSVKRFGPLRCEGSSPKWYRWRSTGYRLVVAVFLFVLSVLLKVAWRSF
jgi:hypothetical protein